MPRGRPAREDGNMITKHVYLPSALVAQVELALPFDALRGTPKQGSWSHLVESLLREWVTKNRAKNDEEQKKGDDERCQSIQ